MFEQAQGMGANAVAGGALDYETIEMGGDGDTSVVSVSGTAGLMQPPSSLSE